MNLRVVVLMIICSLLGACAHPITIAPKSDMLYLEGDASPRSVAYLISEEDRGREVTTSGGGGESVTYFPYRDLETGFFHALSALYRRVTLVRSLTDKARIEKNDVSLVFIPRVTTSSSSSAVFSWMPTAFSVTIEYTVQDVTGRLVHKNVFLGTGNATFNEINSEGEFGLAGRRAAEDALRKFQQQVRNAPELR